MIFVAAISEYDQKLFEDSSTNRMVSGFVVLDCVLWLCCLGFCLVFLCPLFCGEGKVAVVESLAGSKLVSLFVKFVLLLRLSFVIIYTSRQPTSVVFILCLLLFVSEFGF